MNSRVEKITPELAKKYLASNHLNRPINEAVVLFYSRIIVSGQWKVSPQGISFDLNGVLIDGQHRLSAIVKAGITVEVYVTRGAEPSTRDVMDEGLKRSLGTKLRMFHGVDNQKDMAAACSVVAQIAIGGVSAKRLSVSQALCLLEIYRAEFESMFRQLSSSRLTRNSNVFGTLAFCMKAYPQEISVFAEQLASGENLEKGTPALTLRNRFIATTAAHHRVQVTETQLLTMGAAMAHVQGRQLTKVYANTDGPDFFRVKQEEHLLKIRHAFGLDG